MMETTPLAPPQAPLAPQPPARGPSPSAGSSSASSASSSSSEPASPTTITTAPPHSHTRTHIRPRLNPRQHPHHHRRRRAAPRHTVTAPAVINGGVDSPPNYANQPFQPEQQTSHTHHGGSISSPLLTRAPRPQDSGGGVVGSGHSHGVGGISAGLYRLNGLNLSDTSLDSNALLDHRGQQYMRPRRSSAAQGGVGGGTGLAFGARRFPGTGFADVDREREREREREGDRDRGGDPPSPVARDPRVYITTPGGSTSAGKPRSRPGLQGLRQRLHHGGTESDSSPYSSSDEHDETTRLLGPSDRRSRGGRSTDGRSIMDIPRGQGRDSHLLGASISGAGGMNYGSVNFPPSVPTSPRIEPTLFLDGTKTPGRPEDVIIDIERLGSSAGAQGRVSVGGVGGTQSTPTTPPPEGVPQMTRQPTLRAEEDVCFPIDECSSIHSLSLPHPGDLRTGRHHHRPARSWPDLSVLEEWSREEKEQRSEGVRAKKTNEPVYVNGRLRPGLRANSSWHREVEDAPYRFTYFSDELPNTIHAHTISELLLPGMGFGDLFRPEPRKYADDEHEWEDEEVHTQPPQINNSHVHSTGGSPPHDNEVDTTPPVGARPTFWLDVLSPTEAEMKILSKAFGIHPLTAEDIMMQEAREKVELFRSYYLVSYKSFEQDMGSEDYLDPVNIYVVVFREGVISFHFSLTPHPANVRRRIRQLKDYITVSADWISYALIDDITDAFAPLIQSIEEEVDDIDERILQLHVSPEDPSDTQPPYTPPKNPSCSSSSTLQPQEKDKDTGGNMLKRVGDCRKKVMGLYRLLGNKADVIKGFAKRCNEQWEVAPRSEIGLYLGDIQDHIVTMVANLNHYEKILSRSHSNYLAQINIQMNQRQERTADVLGRLTVLGTIVLPMNIITGLWGMNVLVPGQEQEGLVWFFGITGALLIFGFVCFWGARRVYGIV